MGLGKKTIDDQNYCGKKVLVRCDFTIHHTHMAYSLYNITCSWFPFCTNHRSTFVDSSKSLT